MYDIRFALRQLVKSPGFTAVALLTIAIGIGACAAIFSVVDGLLIRPLPYFEPERLVVVEESKPPDLPQFAVAPGQYVQWRKQSTSFESLTAMKGEYRNLTGMGDPIRVPAWKISANTFSTLGIRPMLGRDFSESDDVPGREKVVILRHGFWLRQFGGRRDVLNHTVQLDGETFLIIGVMPKNLHLDGPVDLFMPIAFSPEEVDNHGMHFLRVLGRLKAGTTVEQARAEMALVGERLAQQYPATNKGWGMKLTSLFESTVGDVGPALFSLFGAVGFLLLIACTNMANLLLARASSRSREIAVRVALGASRGRIVRQLATESLLLASAGGILGVLFAHWGLHALLSLAPDILPRASEIGVDARTIGFAGGLALVTGLGFGLVPALQATRIDLNELLKEGGRTTSEGGHGLRSALVVAEVGIALVLLAGAGLLIRSFAKLRSVDPGFRSENAIAIDISMSPENYGSKPQQVAFVEEAIKRLTSLRGVESVGASQTLPFSGNEMATRLRMADLPATADLPSTDFYAVTPDYFKAMGVRLLRGRMFEPSDGANGAPVAIINASLAKKFFANEDPIGKRIAVGRDLEEWREIVGVVGDVKQNRLDEEGRMQTYEPFAQLPMDFVSFVVRYAGDAPGLIGAARTAIYAVDKDQSIGSIRPLEEFVADSTARQRFAMFLFAVFSGVALLLAAIGIYGVMAYSVARRTGEIGIRIALGARTNDILRMMFRQAGTLIALGTGAGLIGAVLLSRFLAAMLFGVSAYDPTTFLSTALLLSFVAAVACLIPSMRAAKVDPLTALRAR